MLLTIRRASMGGKRGPNGSKRGPATNLQKRGGCKDGAGMVQGWCKDGAGIVQGGCERKFAVVKCP